MLLGWSTTDLDSVLKSRDVTLLTKVYIVKAMVFSVVVYSYDSWTVKKAEWQRIDEKTAESPLDSKEIKPVNLKRNQSQILIGRTDAEAETPVFWSPDLNSWLIGKVPDAGKDWGQEEKRALENDEMAGWHHWCNGHELEQTSGDGEGQRVLVCFSQWGPWIGHNWVTEQQQP